MADPKEVNAFILDPLNFKDKNFIILPLNNNSEDSAGGSHWSLLVYSKPDTFFFHFDSLAGSNSHACKELVNILMGSLNISKDSHKVEQVDCLQQNNSYDCGIYALCHADLVCKTIMKSKTLKGIKKINYKNVLSKRSELLEIIKSLEGTKKNSK